MIDDDVLHNILSDWAIVFDVIKSEFIYMLNHFT
jgi:hypothetical protein